MIEFTKDMRSLDEWLAFRDSNPDMTDQGRFDTWGNAVLARGCIEPLTNTAIAPEQLEHLDSWREGLGYHGINSRVRAVMRCLADGIDEQRLQSPRLYAAEGLTPFALRLRGLFPRFVGSEFTLDPTRRAWMYPIPCEDLQALTLTSNSFDMVSTNEVLEHVPSIDKALAELHRVLRPGGWHFGTVPFRYFSDTPERRTRLTADHRVEHLLPPEYHGDPMNDGGALVFEMPAWDIIGRARAAGFGDAFMRFMVSTRFGVVSEHIGGVFVFCCRK